jgi:hypothetical protein
MEQLFNWLQKYATGKLVNILFVLTQIVYLLMIVPVLASSP